MISTLVASAALSFILGCANPPEIPQPVEPTPIVESYSYSVSEDEINLMALLCMAEAEGESELAQRLVIDTILNRVDHPHFPDSIYGVIYQENAFSPITDGRLERCWVDDYFVNLVKEELENRTSYDPIFFMAGGYSAYGDPLYLECCVYFSSLEG